MNPNTAKLVRVNWHDYISVSNWNDEDDDIRPPAISSIGYLIEETPTEIIVATSYNWDDDRWSDFTAFPKTPPEIQEIESAPQP